MTPHIPQKLIAEKTAEAFGFSFLDMISARRSAGLVEARRIAWILIKELCDDASTPEIGRLFCRDHSTVVVGLQRGRKRLDNDAMFREAVDDVRKTLRNWPEIGSSNDIVGRESGRSMPA